MIFGWYRDPTGRICPVYRPETLSEVELNLEEVCQPDEPDDDECPYGPPAGGPMEGIGPEERVYLQDEAGVAVEFTGKELSQKEAAGTLHRLTLQELARYPALSYASAFERVKKINGDLLRKYTGTSATQRDIERRPAEGTVVVEHGTARYHIDQSRRYHSDDFLLPLPEGIRATFVPVPGAALPGTQRPATITFEKSRWTRGRAEGWLTEKGLIASFWQETFSEIEATIYSGLPSGEPRVASTAEGKIPTSPLLEKLRKLREREKVVRMEIRELSKLMNISYFEAMEIVLADDRHSALPDEIREQLRAFYGPPKMQ